MDIEDFIRKHLNHSVIRDNKRLDYTAEELHELCKMSVTVFKQQPMLAKMNPPCAIVGDLRGQYRDLLRVFSLQTAGKVSGAIAQKYVFLGNYIGGGGQSLEILCIILALMIRFPSKYIVLRGSQEVFPLSRTCGFFEEISERFDIREAQGIWESFDKVFQWMPLAALIGQKIFCVHGGISPHLKNLIFDISSLPRPLENPENHPLAHDLLWAEPRAGQVGFAPNNFQDKKTSVFFGEDEVHNVCKEFDVGLIVRSHQLMNSGYVTFADAKLLSIFSAPRFQNGSNAGASLMVSAEGRVQIKLLCPPEFTAPRMAEETTEESARTVDTNSEIN